MEDINNSLTSANFNEIWLKNIYDNIAKFELHESLARDGCNDIFEYSQMPISEIKFRIILESVA